MSFVELGRGFEVYRDDEPVDEAVRRSYIAGSSRLGRQLDWSSLLKHRLVVVLGEPGSGKSEELRSQHRTNDGSFFLRLEQLVSADLNAILSDEEFSRFERWKGTAEPGLFFLDAVDESKLERDDDFIVALERFANALGNARYRARLVISSRISEWRPQTDRSAVLQRFTVQAGSLVPSDASDDPPILIVTILPLTPMQVRMFAESKGIHSVERFLEALEQHNAWSFAGRPLDVSNLYAYWKDKGTLSGLTDLTEYMVSKLLAEVSSKERGDPLTPDRARDGAEYLAAAAILCLNLKFQISDDGHIASQRQLFPQQILPGDWTPQERRALMDRAIFDAESRGALSFHHRSHVEYLTACWFERLMAHNCPFEALQDVFFVRADGAVTLRAALAPVAAWLVKSEISPWRARFADLVIESAPEIHLRWGDPAALPVEYRKKILRAIVDRYRGRDYAYVNIDLDALGRIADSALSEDISVYLLENDVPESLKIDLLMIIMEGALAQCVSSVLDLFRDRNISDRLRGFCILAIDKAGTLEHRRILAESYLDVGYISNRTIGYLFEALFPDCLSVDGALSLLQRPEGVNRYDTTFFNSIKNHLMKSLNDANAMSFLKGLVEMSLREPLGSAGTVSQRFHWVVSLIPMCLAVAIKGREFSDLDTDTLFDAVLIVEHDIMFNGQSDTDNEAFTGYIRRDLASSDALRRAIFWRRVDRLRHTQNGKQPPLHLLNPHIGLSPWGKKDAQWMIADSLTRTNLEDRVLAVEAASEVLRRSRISIFAALWELRSAVKRSELRPWIIRYIRNWIVGPLWLKYHVYIQNRLLDRHWWMRYRYEFRNWKNGLQFRVWLWFHLKQVRSGSNLYVLGLLTQTMDVKGGSQYGTSAWDKARAKWGSRVADAAKRGCINVWREYSPPFPHEREVRNSVDYRVVLGLIALQSMWSSGDLDFTKFTASDAIRAARYACSELNGLPEWFSGLAAARSAEVEQTLLLAVEGEFDLPASDLHINEVVAKLAWTKTPTTAGISAVRECLSKRDPLNKRVLEQAISVVLQSENSYFDELSALASSRTRQYQSEHDFWLLWLSTWCRLDALPALRYLDSIMRKREADKADELVELLCSILGGSHGTRLEMGRASFLLPTSLGILIPLIHRHVRRDEDIDRTNNGAYSPTARDNAQDFRDRLWETLRTSESSEADDVLRTFLDDASLISLRDWVLSILEERQARRADPTAWFQEDVRAFGLHYRHKPRSSYQLYQLTTRLLLEIKANVEASENATDRLQVRLGDREADFQGFLKRQLDQRSLQWFSVTQESVVDLNQRPDLRVDIPDVGAIPVEVKLANLGWTVKSLLERLEVQLVGQYLRAQQISFGIYAIGNVEPDRQWQHPDDSRLIGFPELISLLQARALELASQHKKSVHGLRVIGIDFSDPRSRRK